MVKFEECLSILRMDYANCPGRYCGRLLLDKSNCSFSECQKCPRGYRPSDLDVCQLCTNDLTLYDYMYLGFALNFSIILNFVFIDRSLWLIIKKNYEINQLKIAFIYLSSIVECLTAFLLTVLIFSPTHTLKLQTCSVQSIYDWYSIFFNPYIDYYHKLNCSQEIVYPLYSFCLVFFMLAILIMICVRPNVLRVLFKEKIISKILNQPTFAALYFYPLMIIMHVVAGGFLYYTYPYITIILFLIANAFYLSEEFKEISRQNKDLVETIIFTVKLFKKPRHLFMMFLHWYFYSFSIIAIAAFKSQSYDYFYLLFVPAPLIFFVISYKHTNPENFKP